MADITAGQRLVQILDEGLAPNVEWDAAERVVLTLVEQSADRTAVLQTLLDAEMAKPEVAGLRVCELAAEIRQAEAAIAKIAKSLNPEMVQAKSLRHMRAANVRWHGGASWVLGQRVGVASVSARRSRCVPAPDGQHTRR